MIQCPGCGGALKFDIPSQQMKCDSCSQLYNPYSINYGTGAEESTEYDVTVFKCPQCGGEIISTDETAAAFCSYCGSSNYLQSRVSKEKKPELIIPFKQSKQQCKDAYAGFMKRAIFAPNAYKESGRVDGFRGIYMPYWLYDMSQNGPIDIKSYESHRRGDYIITNHYMLTGYMDNNYNGVSYDASSSFADDISNEIAPFNVKDITTFSPAFLSGYYADIADVGVNTYVDTARELASEGTFNYLTKKTPIKGNSLEESKQTIKNKIEGRTVVNVTRSAMFPVWFLSYRSRDRVAYATVNGQTGKVSADLPVSIPKYFICAGILSVIIFLILQLFFTMTPDVVMVAIAIVGLIGVILYNSEMKSILAKENYENDLGMQDRMERKKQNRMNAQTGAEFTYGENETHQAIYQEGANGQSVMPGQGLPPQGAGQRPKAGQGSYVLTDNDVKRAKNKKAGKKGFNLGSLITVVIVVAFFIPAIFGGGAAILSEMGFETVGGLVGLAAFVVAVILSISSQNKISKMVSKKGITATIWSTVSLLIVTVISFWDPPNDAIYYAAAIISMIGLAINLIDLMASYNYIAMRPLPQFEMYQGGDDRA